MKLQTSVLLSVLVACSLCGHAGELIPVPGNPPAEALALKDLGGHTHRLENYRGKVVLLNFWASWCTPCLLEMPSLQQLQDEFSGTPFTILAVNVQESRERVWRFRQLLDLDFIVLLDTDGSAAGDWDVSLYPTSYLIDTAGNIRFVSYGPRDWYSEEVYREIEVLQKSGRESAHAAIPALNDPVLPE